LRRLVHPERAETVQAELDETRVNRFIANLSSATGSIQPAALRLEGVDEEGGLR